MPMNPAAPVTSTRIGGVIGHPPHRRRLRPIGDVERAQLGVLEEASEHAYGDVGEAGGAVEKAQPEEVEPDEPCERRQRDLREPGGAALAMHRRRLQRRVAVLLGNVVGQRFGRRMQQVAVDPRRMAVDDHVLVHDVVAPARPAPVEQAHVPVRIAFAVIEPAAEEPVAARDGERARARVVAREDFGDPRRELGRHALVGVEAQHPVVRGRGDGELLLRAEARERMVDHARAEALRDFHGIIAAPRIDDHGVRREARRFETTGQVTRGIARDDAKRQGKRFGHVPAAAGIFVKARFYVVSCACHRSGGTHR